MGLSCLTNGPKRKRNPPCKHHMMVMVAGPGIYRVRAPRTCFECHCSRVIKKYNFFKKLILFYVIPLF
jgi:hypothetical protein